MNKYKLCYTDNLNETYYAECDFEMLKLILVMMCHSIQRKDRKRLFGRIEGMKIGKTIRQKLKTENNKTLWFVVIERIV